MTKFVTGRESVIPGLFAFQFDKDPAISPFLKYTKNGQTVKYVDVRKFVFSYFFVSDR